MEGLTRRYGDVLALDHVTFRIPHGGIHGLLGLNGAGKTTTLRILSTLLKPTGGAARVLGHDVQREPLAVRRALGIVADDVGRGRLDWRITHYLEYFGSLHGFDRAQVHARAKPLLDRLLDPRFHHARMDTLSAGMRKKVEIVRALLPEPRVLLLDEPTKDLDIPTKEDLWGFLRDECGRRALTVLLSSHDALEVQTLCMRVVVLQRGRLVHDGHLKELDARDFQRSISALLTGAAR